MPNPTTHPTYRDVPDVSDEWFHHEPEQGMLVELHSLSKDELNGRQGECMVWLEAKERWEIRLLAGASEQSIAVRPANLRRAPRAATEQNNLAEDSAIRAIEVLQSMRRTHQGGYDPAAVAKVNALLDEAEQHSFACTMVHQARGDLAIMAGNLAMMVVHLRRAVANGYNLQGADAAEPNAGRGEQQLARRVALAGALGNSGDLAGEEKQLRLVLAANPGHIHARLSLGQNLCQRGQDSDALPELLMALQLPNDGPGRLVDEYTVCMVRCQAARKLASVYGRKASALSQQRQHRAAIEQLQKLAKILREALDGPIFLTSEDRGEAVPTSHQSQPVAAGSTVAATFGANGRPVSQVKEVVEMVLDLARTEANMAGDFLELDERANAEEVLGRSKAALALHPDADADDSMHGRLMYEAGKCKEHAGDEAVRESRRNDDAATFFSEAKEMYRASHKRFPDQAAQQGFSRVQAKAHPDMEYVQVGPGGGGYARPLKPGVQLETLK